MSVVGAQPKKHANTSYKATKHIKHTFLISDYYEVLYFPVYNAHFFPAEKAPKIEVSILYTESFVVDLSPSLACKQMHKKFNLSIHSHLLLIEKLKTEQMKK